MRVDIAGVSLRGKISRGNQHVKSHIYIDFFIVLQQFWSVWGRDKPVEECLHVQAPHSPFKQKVVKAETWDRV